MQSVLSRIWTHVTVSISYDDNHYTTGLHKGIYSFPKGISRKGNLIARLEFELAYFMAAVQH